MMALRPTLTLDRLPARIPLRKHEELIRFSVEGQSTDDMAPSKEEATAVLARGIHPAASREFHSCEPCMAVLHCSMSWLGLCRMQCLSDQAIMLQVC